MRDAGVTRISLGVQSFDDAKLRALDRQHDRAAAIAAVRIVQAAGMHVCVDLIFAGPGETLDAWRRDLDDAVALEPDHISTYGLTFEQGTAFTVSRERGVLRSADEELERAMYAEAIDALTAAGYEHYEVSNFARPQAPQPAQRGVLGRREYFAAGPGAARYVGGVRETNIRSTLGYLDRMLAGQSPVAEREQLTPERAARERLVLGLRRLRGVERSEFAAASGYSFDALAGAAITRFVAAGLLEDDGCTCGLRAKACSSATPYGRSCCEALQPPALPGDRRGSSTRAVPENPRAEPGADKLPRLQRRPRQVARIRRLVHRRGIFAALFRPRLAVFLAGVIAEPDIRIAVGVRTVPVQVVVRRAGSSSRATAGCRDRSGSRAAGR